VINDFTITCEICKAQVICADKHEHNEPFKTGGWLRFSEYNTLGSVYRCENGRTAKAKLCPKCVEVIGKAYNSGREVYNGTQLD